MGVGLGSPSWREQVTSVGVPAVGLSLARQPLVATNEEAARLDAWQFVTGVGPLVEAYQRGVVVELGRADVIRRWPVLEEFLVEAGVTDVISFPITLGSCRLGALTFYGCDGFALHPARREVAARLARGAGIELLEDVDGVPSETFGGLDRFNHAVGMTMHQLHLPAEDAAARLRAHSYASRCPLARVVDGVLDGTLTLEA